MACRHQDEGMPVTRFGPNMGDAPEASIATFSDPDDNHFQLVSPV